MVVSEHRRTISLPPSRFSAEIITRICIPPSTQRLRDLHGTEDRQFPRERIVEFISITFAPSLRRCVPRISSPDGLSRDFKSPT